MRSFNANMAEDNNYNTSQSNLAAGQRQPAVGQQLADMMGERGQPLRSDSLQHLEELASGAPGSGRQSATPAGRQTTRIADEMSQDLQFLAREAPLDGGESTFGAYSTLGGDSSQQAPAHSYTAAARRDSLANGNDYERADFRIDHDDDQQAHQEASQLGRQASEPPLEQLAPDNVDIQRPLQQMGRGGRRGVEEAASPASQVEWSAADQPGQLSAPAANNVAIDGAGGALQSAGQVLHSTLPLRPFLVSFMVDARGGAMRGCRHSGVRVIIPPATAPQPMRITCRYLRRERLVHPPPLMEGEACASKIMEVGPAGAKFLGPVLIEVPHFASLRGKEREIIILRSDTGEVWREHLVEADDSLAEQIISAARHVEETGAAYYSDQENQTRPSSAAAAAAGKPLDGGGGGDSQQQQQQQEKRLTRIVTNEFPQYFAIISRIRQQVHTVGPEGSLVDSQAVPRVQAIFTEGALTKRIKIGLQKRSSPDEEAREETGSKPEEASRAQSPSSVATDAGRPGSAAKRRRRFLACFGAGNGSHDPLDQSGTEADCSSAGGESPRQLAKEKLVERRHIVVDVSDSEQEDSSSLELANVGAPNEPAATQLVPEDYYMERESPLILNLEPTTYGKRMASSSAQTDQKLQVNGFMSTSTRGTKGKRRGVGLLRGKRARSKTQMTIPLHEPTAGQREAAKRLAANSPPPADSSLDSVACYQQQPEAEKSAALNSLASHHEQGAEAEAEAYAHEEPANFKCLTRTIQTDSDSVTVQYVTLFGVSGAAEAVEAAAAAAVEHKASVPTGCLDDGYVSGSGDLKKEQQAAAKAKGIFSPFCAGSAKPHQADESSLDDDARLKLTGAGQLDVLPADDKKQKKQKKQKSAETQAHESGPLQSDEQPERAASPKADELQASGGEEADESQLTSTTSRSISPTSKELKAKLKLQKAEKAKRDKLERQKQKEADETQAKALKAQKKLEKAAKKRAGREQKALAKSKSVEPSGDEAADEQTTTSTTATSEQSGAAAKQSGASGLGASLSKTIQSVKFAPSPTKSAGGGEQAAAELESEAVGESPTDDQQQQNGEKARSSPTKLTKQVIDSMSSKFKVKLPRLTASRADRKPDEQQAQDESMVHVSIGESSLKEQQTITAPRDVSFDDEIKQATEPLEGPAKSLKPILKQQSSASSADENQQLASIASELVNEATEAAVKVAEELASSKAHNEPADEARQHRAQAGAQDSSISPSSGSSGKSKRQLAKQAKAERQRLKEEAKQRLAEEKRTAQQLEQLVKQAEEAAKRAEHEATKVTRRLAEEAERQARIAIEQAELEADTKPNVMDEPECQTDFADQSGSATKSAKSSLGLKLPKLGGKKLKSDKREADEEAPRAKTKAKRAKKEKKVEKDAQSSSSSTGPSSSQAASKSSSSFLGRLFKSSKSKQAPAVGETAAPTATAPAKDDQKHEGSDASAAAAIVSEMYPSDPNNADGELILEVNVPEGLMSRSEEEGQQAQQVPEQQATATTTSSTTAGEPTDDQEATLVNMSQMADEDEPAGGRDDDDEATENVLSQATSDHLPGQENLDSVADALADETPRAEWQQPPVQVDDSPAKLQPVSELEASQAVELDTTKSVQVEQQPQPQQQPQPALDEHERKLSGKELKSEKNRKELEVKLEKEAKKRAKEEEKLRKNQEAEAKKLAEAEAKRVVREAKERAKREAKEAKKLAELAKKEAKEAERASKKRKKMKTEETKMGEPAAEVKTANEGRAAAEEPKVTTSTVVLSSSSSVERQTDGAESAEGSEPGRLLLSSTIEEPPMEETETERIVEEVLADDGTITKTTKTIETKYVTTRQEEIRVAERRASGQGPWDEVESMRRGTEPLASTGSPAPPETSVARAELEQIRAVPSYFLPDQLPAEIKPETAAKKVAKKRVKLNQKLIKRALKLARSEASHAKQQRARAEAEIAVCDEAAKRARSELKRSVKEAKRAVREAAKEHKKMDKVDKELAKRAEKIEKRQKKIDKKLAKSAKKADKRRAKEAKKADKAAGKADKARVASASSSSSASRASPSRSSKKSIKLEDISAPILRSSSRLSVGRQTSEERAAEEGEQQQQQVVEAAQTEGAPVDQAEPDLRPSEQHDGQSAAGAAALQSELAAARDEEDEVIDVVGVDGDADELEQGENAENAENVTPTSTPDVSQASSGGSGQKGKRKRNKKQKRQKSSEGGA